MRLFRLHVLSFLIALIAGHQSMAESELEKLLSKVDRVYRSESSYAVLKMKMKTPHWDRTLKMKAWTKGLEQIFITILSPRKEKGISTLKKENEMWNYFPRVNKVIKVPPSMMMGSWMGSDFTNDDLVKENTYREDFESRIIKKENNVFTIELIPKKETITVWGKIHLLVDKVKLVPIRQDFFNEKGKLVRKINFEKIQKISGKFVPMRMVLTPLTKKGNSTTVEYVELKFNVPIKSSFFSIRNLQKRR